MISVNGLSVEFSATPLFDNISYVINRRDRIALVGKNGAGKSTMLKIIAGLQMPTSGSVSVPQGITIGYLPQQMKLSDEVTVMEEVRKAFSHVDDLHQQLDNVTRQLAEATDFDSPQYQNLIDRLDSLNQRIAIEASDNCEAEMEKTLIGLGFKRTDFNRPTSEFSGGWRMRIELAKLLLQRPDVLLLDEPTNHLDIESIQWLEKFLVSNAQAVMLVSHDRAFIDNVTTRTIEISLGKIYDYNVKYSQFVQLRKERIEQQMRAYQNQQKQIADTEEFIERFRYKATKAVQVQSRMKQLAKIERIQVDEVDNSHLRLKFPPAPRSGDYPLIIEDLGKAYGDHQVFDHATFTLKRGDKVAFVGKNGEGKSTLVKCIMNQIPYTGKLQIGHNVKIGYFAQNQAQLLDESLTVFDTVDRAAVGDIRTKIRDILGAFMFGGEASDKPVKVLSGGEKTRLAMIQLLLDPVNLLILDEPTNHLDMRTKDILKEAIRDFTGTVIVVSHDREFLDGLVQKVYEFGDGKVKEHLGGIYDFIEHKKIESLQDLERSNPNSNSNTNSNTNSNSNSNSQSANAQSGKSQSSQSSNFSANNAAASGQNSNSKASEDNKKETQLSYAERREREKKLKRLRKKVEEAENQVSLMEQKVKEIEDRISAGETAPEIFNEHAQANKELENAMSYWEMAVMDLDEASEE